MLMRLEIIRRDSENHHVVLLEFGEVIPEVACFTSASRRLVLRVEVQDYRLLALELLERNIFARGRRQAEIGCRLPDHRQHAGCHPSSQKRCRAPHWKPGCEG